MKPTDDPVYTIEEIDGARALTLRRALLQPAGAGSADDPADRDAATVHFGAFRSGVLVGVATVVPSLVPGAGSAARLHGLVVEHGHRGRGVGHLLLAACAAAAEKMGAEALAASVPAGAHGFFAREGFIRVGDPFEDPDGTPRYRMRRPLHRLS